MWFKAKKGYGTITHEWDGKYIEFNEETPTEAPKEFVKHKYTLDPCDPPERKEFIETKEKKKEVLNAGN